MLDVWAVLVAVLRLLRLDDRPEARRITLGCGALVLIVSVVAGWLLWSVGA